MLAAEPLPADAVGDDADDSADVESEAKAKKIGACDAGAPAAKSQVVLTATDATIKGRTVNIDPANACAVLTSGKSWTARNKPGGITHVVIHMIERANYAGTLEGWRKGGGHPCCKPHYAVSMKGDITQIVAERDIAAHGNATNGYSVGIEHEGFSRRSWNLTEELYLASAALTRDICLRHGIPMDGTHVIGHDMAAGNCTASGGCHGDPGGYWDWQYYLALVNWDGAASTKPVRIVVDTSSPQFAAGSSWKRRAGTLDEDRRVAAAKNGKLPEGGPRPQHSWSKEYAYAAPDPKAGTTGSAVFRATIPTNGRYDVSIWNPSRANQNSAAFVKVDKIGHLWGSLGTQMLVQNSFKGRTRKTLALPATPTWKNLGTFDCVKGNDIVVEISRASPKSGEIVADAIRIFKVG